MAADAAPDASQQAEQLDADNPLSGAVNDLIGQAMGGKHAYPL